MIFGNKRDQEQRDRLVAYKHVFSTPHGKTVLHDLMNHYHILNHHTGDVFAEGQRSVVLGILAQLKITLEDFDKLLEGTYE